MNTHLERRVPGFQPLLQGFASARRRLSLPLLLLLGLGLLGAAWLRSHWGVEETDNAQLQAHLVEISSRVSGTIAQVPVQDDQGVTHGTPLVLLDRRDALVALRRAEADLLEARRQADALVAAAGSSLSGAAAAADQQVARAEFERSGSDLRRLEFQLRQGGVSRQEVDKARAAYQQARGQLTRSQTTAQQARASESQVGGTAKGRSRPGPHPPGGSRPGQRPPAARLPAHPGAECRPHRLAHGRTRPPGAAGPAADDPGVAPPVAGGQESCRRQGATRDGEKAAGSNSILIL